MGGARRGRPEQGHGVFAGSASFYELGQAFAALTNETNPIPAPAPVPVPDPTPGPAPEITAEDLAADIRALLESKGV